MSTSRRLALTLAIPAVLTLAACGGGGGSGGVASTPPPPAAAPTPTPPPSAPPTPPAFTPQAATIFAGPLYNPSIAVAGKGWQYDYVPNSAGAQNIRDADAFSVTYDQATGKYQVSVPVAGSGTLMQVDNTGSYLFGAGPLVGFHADPSAKSPTNYCCATLSVAPADQPKSRYQYVSFVDVFAPAPAGTNLDTIAYGSFVVGQPTKPAEVPTTGTARFTGDLFGHFAGDSAATWLQGTAQFDFDFAKAALSGQLAAGIRCMMGCSYGEVVYSFAETQFARGATSFSGQLVTAGAPSTGTFSGLFAGPGAAELMAQFRMPYYNPEHQRWTDAGGAIAAKRE